MRRLFQLGSEKIQVSRAMLTITLFGVGGAGAGSSSACSSTLSSSTPQSSAGGCTMGDAETAADRGTGRSRLFESTAKLLTPTIAAASVGLARMKSVPRVAIRTDLGQVSREPFHIDRP